MSGSSDFCRICKTSFEFSKAEEWRTEDGIRIHIPKTIKISIEDPKHRGFYVCEDCYRKNFFLDYKSKEIWEIHTEFGLEFLHAKRFEDAEAAFRKALSIRVDADILAFIASSLSDRNPQEAMKFYIEALNLDKNHFMASKNLSLLQRQIER